MVLVQNENRFYSFFIMLTIGFNVLHEKKIKIVMWSIGVGILKIRKQ